MSQPAFDFGDEYHDASDDASVTYSVSELADAINGTLRRNFGDGLWIRGEIQGWSERGQHAYFRLGDNADNGKAVVNVQFFANSRMRLRPLLQKHRLRLADGLKVRIFGHLDFYAPSGQLGLKMSGIDARFTLGDLAVQRSEVVRRLVATGLYDANRRHTLAVAPLRVGVVTSIGSAAWADFVHEIERSALGFRLRAIDVRVQGELAAEMVSRAITTLGRHDDLDVIVVVRGGGSRTDLAVFDHEAIALAIASSPLPVLTGLGHEIDRSIADEVANLSLKTPTACATALVEQVVAFLGGAEATYAAVLHRSARTLDRSAGRVDELDAAIHLRTDAALTRSAEHLDHRRRRVRDASTRRLERADAQLQQATAALRRVPAKLDSEARHLAGLERQVRLVDPIHTLARGWSITRTEDGRTVRTAADLVRGDTLVTTFAAGTAESRIELLHATPDPSAATQPSAAIDHEDTTP